MSRPAKTRRLLGFALLIALAWATSARAADRYFTSSDGVLLHYIEAGPPNAETIVFIPGWTMPAWIWQRQIDFFSRRYHVVAFDPRSQGDSAVPPSGYEPGRRSEDIHDLFNQLGYRPVLLVGWSLGVLDSLAYIHVFGDRRIAGLVLVDNSIGEDPPPPPRPRQPRPRVVIPRDVEMRAFVRGMFRQPISEDYVERLTQATLRTPPYAAAALLSYPMPRTYWKEAVYAVTHPVLYVVRPRLEAQAANLAARHLSAETALFADAGHALFVDEADRFNALLLGFIQRRVWP